jgi:hypothetical protein
MEKKTFRQEPLINLTLVVCLYMLLGLNSCQKSGTTVFTDLPVVEAYLSPDQKIVIRISQKAAFDDGTEIPSENLDALDINVVSNGTAYSLIPLGYGVYCDTAGAVRVVPDSSYSLRFNYGGMQISSTTIIPSKPMSVTQSVTSITMSQFDPENPTGSTHPDPIEISFANPDASYYLATIECIDTTLVPVFKDSIPANDIFSSQPVTGTEIDIQPMMIRYFGMNRIILYHINPEYSTFFMRQASTSQSYQEPPTNIVNGLGIFTGINADTLYLNIIQQ